MRQNNFQYQSRRLTVVYMELNESGEFVNPGFAKSSVVNKPATEAPSGLNLFTKEPIEFAAKPASKSVKASALKVTETLFEVGGLVQCVFVRLNYGYFHTLDRHLHFGAASCNGADARNIAGLAISAAPSRLRVTSS
jgi:hypothetical protein